MNDEDVDVDVDRNGLEAALFIRIKRKCYNFVIM